MASASTIIKAATSALAASAALLTALKENPQLADGAKTALEKIRSATDSQNPRLRFEAKIAAIEACADAVEVQFPGAAEVTEWREAAAALKLRGNLTWDANHGRRRKLEMRKLNDATTKLLERINARLAELTPGVILQDEPKQVEAPRRFPFSRKDKR